VICPEKCWFRKKTKKTIKNTIQKNNWKWTAGREEKHKIITWKQRLNRRLGKKNTKYTNTCQNSNKNNKVNLGNTKCCCFEGRTWEIFWTCEIQDRLKGRGSPKVQWHTDLIPMVLVKQVPPMCQGFWNPKMVLCSDFFWSLTSGLYQLLSSDCFVQLEVLSHPIKFDERTQWLIIKGRQHLKTIFVLSKFGSFSHIGGWSSVHTISRC
jgi:hypothetical protein